MPFNGSGVFQRLRNWVADATAGIKIRADYHDAEDDGFAAGLSNTITKDGQTIITQNIPFNSKRITGLADPVNPQDAATKAYTVAKSGDTMAGDLHITKASPRVWLDDTGPNSSSSGSGISGAHAGSQRWLMRFGNDTAETGADAGSNFDLHCYNDAGLLLSRVLQFDRATALGTVAGPPVSTFGIANKAYVDNGDANKVIRTGDTMTGLLTSAESGSISQPGAATSFRVFSNGDNACLAFHCQGIFGANFGLAFDGNFYMGGFSHGGTAYKFWTQRDFVSLPATVDDLNELRARIEALEKKEP